MRSTGSKAKSMLGALAALLVICFAPGIAGAATVTVCASGCDQTTIQAAITAATPGDTITVAAGTYAEAVIINKPLTLQGAGDDEATGTVINPDGHVGAITVTADDVTVQGVYADPDDTVLGYGLHVDSAIQNLTLDGVTLTGGINGLFVDNRGDIDGLTISDSHFDGNTFGWYFARDNYLASIGTTVTNVTVTGSTANDNARKGLYIEKLENALFDGLTVDGSGVDPTWNFNNGIDINLKFADFENIELRNVTVTGSGLSGPETQPFTPAGIAIKARDDGATYGANPATLDSVTLANVVVSGGVVGIRFGESNKNNAGPANVSISGSSFSSTSGVLLDNQTQSTVTANDNWWGQEDGPAAGQVTGAGTTTTSRWCTDASCATLSNNADLTALSLSSGTLSPTFNSATTAYTANVDNGVNSVTVSRTTSPGASSVVTGSVLNNIGANTVTITVTSADSSTQKVYTVTVNRAAPVSSGGGGESTPPTTQPPTTTPPTTTPPTTVPPVIARPPDNPPPPPPPPAQPAVVGVVTTPSGNGSIQVTPSGEIISTGDAPKFEGVDDLKLNAPVVNVTLTPTGNGVWLVGSDGGVFTQGDAPFLGSAGGLKLNAPMVSLAPTPSGKGYITVAADGGVFTFGDAKFHGSAGGIKLNAAVVGASLTPSGNGYVLVGKDGGIFTYGDAKFYGSAGGTKLPSPAKSVVMTSTGKGYWITLQNGDVLPFGDAQSAA